MTRDNLLFTTIGLLVGFICGYVMHEVMLERQPRRLVQGAAAATGSPTTGSSGAGTTSQQQAAAPAMEAVQRLRERVAANPNDADALRQLANMNYDIQNWQRAAELYQRYLELRPADPNVITDLGVCLRNLGDSDGALAQFREARQRAPEHWQSLFNEVLVLAFDVGDLTAAKEAVVELQRLQPDHPQVQRLGDEIERRLREG